MFVLLGVGTVLLVAFQYAALRNVEQDLPTVRNDVAADHPDPLSKLNSCGCKQLSGESHAERLSQGTVKSLAVH